MSLFSFKVCLVLVYAGLCADCVALVLLVGAAVWLSKKGAKNDLEKATI